MNKTHKILLALIVMLTIGIVACGGYTTSISNLNGRIDQGSLCLRITVLNIDEQLQEDLLLVFACNERP